MTNRNAIRFLFFLLIFEIGIYSSQSSHIGNNIEEIDSINQSVDNISTPISAQSSAIQFDVVDPREWNLNEAQHYLFSSVEAIVNQNQSRLFVIYDSTELLWYESMNRSLYNGTLLPVSSLKQFCEHYASEIEGIIIYDSSPESSNIATPMVGHYRSILVHKDIYSEVQTYSGFNDMPIIQNLTALYHTQGFTSETKRGEIYRWAFDSFYSNYNKSALAMLNTGISSHLRSFLCMERIFTLWQPVMANITGAPEDDEETKNTFRYILANTPQDIIVFGYMFPDGKNEHPVVRALSENGKYLVPSDFSKNLPFYHRLPIPGGFNFTQNRSIPTPQLENKIYIAGIFSDGDNIQYVSNYMRSVYWESARRKSNPVPITYEISPSLYNIAPYMLYYFYNTATQFDYFVPGVGGKGYTLTEFMSESYFTQYYRSTLDLMDKTDMQEMRTWVTPISEMVEVFNDYNPYHQCKGVYDGYGGSGFQSPYIDNNVIVSTMKSYAGGPEDDLEDIQSLKNVQNGPLFVCYHLYCWDTTYESWANFVGNLSTDSRFEVVTLYQLTDLITQYYERSDSFNPSPEMLQILWILSIFLWIGGFLIFELPAIRQFITIISNKTHMNIKWMLIEFIRLIELGMIITMLFFSQPLRIRGLFELLGQNHRINFIPIEQFYFPLIFVGLGYLFGAFAYRLIERKNHNVAIKNKMNIIYSLSSIFGFTIGLVLLFLFPWNFSISLSLISMTFILFAGLNILLQISLKIKN